MHLANLISIFRILTLPLIVYLLILNTTQAVFWAIVIYGFAVFSDIIDGYIARKTNKKQLIGSFIDPLADKLLIMGLLLYFTLYHQFSWTILLILIVRDFSAGIFRFLSGREDIIFSPRKIYSLAVSTSQFLLVFSLLLQTFVFAGSIKLANHVFLILAMVLFFTTVAVVIAALSFIHSLLFYTSEIKRKKRHSLQIKSAPLAIVANRKAGGYYNSYRRHLLQVFAQRRDAPLFYFPDQKDMYVGIERDLDAYKHVVIAGGDGSFESALNYPPLQKKVLGFFPLGAGNAFYSFFYKGKRYEYLRSRFPFREMELDVVELEWEQGRRQTVFVNIGLDADVIRYSQDRSRHGFAVYLRGCWRSLLKAQSAYHFEVNSNGRKKVFSNCSTIVLGKIPYLGYGLRSLVGIIKPDDQRVYGLAVINRHASWLNKPLRAWALLVGIFNANIPPLLSFNGKEITIRSSIPFPIQAGGEYLGESTWVKLKVVRKQKVLVV